MSKNVVPVVVGKYTFLVTKNSNFVIHSSVDGTRICDGVHNNGGWAVLEKTDKVVKQFVEAYNELG
jgi:hypothetical protein